MSVQFGERAYVSATESSDQPLDESTPSSARARGAKTASRKSTSKSASKSAQAKTGKASQTSVSIEPEEIPAAPAPVTDPVLDEPIDGTDDDPDVEPDLDDMGFIDCYEQHGDNEAALEQCVDDAMQEQNIEG